MHIERGQRVRAKGHDIDDEMCITARRDAPIMVVREICADCSWFTDDGKLNTAPFRLIEITLGTGDDRPIVIGDTVFAGRPMPNAPQMLVREIYAVVTWFVNGAEHRSTYRADELEAVD